MMKPVSMASLVWFRVLFGLIMVWEVFRYFHYDWIGWIFADREFHFKFYGFQWLPEISGNAFYNLWALMGILGLFIAIGFYYRISIIGFTLLFSYQFLMEQSNYLNHFYFVCLMSFILCFISPHHAFSLDAKQGRVRETWTAPFWQHFMICFQMGVVYFYGGIAKFDPDWLTGVPLNEWLDVHEHVPFWGGLLKKDLTALFMSHSGFLLDLLIVPALLWKRTRVFAFMAIFLFHLANHFLFEIGIFPWFSIATSLLFFGPDFLQKILKALNLKWKIPSPEASYPLRTKGWILGVMSLLVFFNLLMPFRHHFYNGDVHWTERGHLYSWRMKLRTKSSIDPVFHFTDLDTGEKWQEFGTDRLSDKQALQMGKRPEMIIQYVQYLKEVARKKGHERVKITVDTGVSLNGRPEQRIIKRDYDLAQTSDCLFCQVDWITDLPEKRTWSRSFQNLKQRLADENRETNLSPITKK